MYDGVDVEKIFQEIYDFVWRKLADLEHHFEDREAGMIELQEAYDAAQDTIYYLKEQLRDG